MNKEKSTFAAPGWVWVTWDRRRSKMRHFQTTTTMECNKSKTFESRHEGFYRSIGCFSPTIKSQKRKTRDLFIINKLSRVDVFEMVRSIQQHQITVPSCQNGNLLKSEIQMAERETNQSFQQPKREKMISWLFTTPNSSSLKRKFSYF